MAMLDLVRHEPTARVAKRGEVEVEKEGEDVEKGRVGMFRVTDARGIERRRLSIN